MCQRHINDEAKTVREHARAREREREHAHVRAAAITQTKISTENFATSGYPNEQSPIYANVPPKKLILKEETTSSQL